LLIVGGADLMLHDRKRLCEAHRQHWGFDLPAGAGEIAGHAVGHGAGMQLHYRLPIAQIFVGRRGIGEQRRHRQRTGKAGGADHGQLEFEGDQHGKFRFGSFDSV
jgi:hypothetical protein